MITIEKYRKVKILNIGDSFKNASDVIGEPSVMMHDLVRSDDGLYHTLQPGDLVTIDLRVLIERNE